MIFLFIAVILLLAFLFGSVGYFICYIQNEKKAEKSKKSAVKYNGWNGIGAYL